VVILLVLLAHHKQNRLIAHQRVVEQRPTTQRLEFFVELFQPPRLHTRGLPLEPIQPPQIIRRVRIRRPIRLIQMHNRLAQRLRAGQFGPRIRGDKDYQHRR
jgi:hypothetical protein